ncbi:putative Ephrin-B2a [Hypsibius exemplaris]|uniref:Ephrin-B2a n=1 Tax=Hypsibius exemplaris TaxID=2072580 RepID=A0A1W0XC67_HYPEX|nr:putative Ephrin-B2a [Hypsibius exemplaris]
MDSDEENICFISLIPEDLHVPVQTAAAVGSEAAEAACDCCRKRDDIRSSGSARAGETTTTESVRPYPMPPTTRTTRDPFRISTLLRYSLLLLIFGSVRWQGAAAIKLPDVYWNSSNPIFRIDNTDHIIDVNKSPQEYDRVNIFCPRIPRAPVALDARTSAGGTDSDSAHNGYYIIYNVSKEEYETCRVTNPTARRMLVCDNPTSDRLSYVTITFRPFSPQPNGPEFHAGQDYYFITTSTGTEAGLDNKFGGRCLSHNMKLLFKVAGQEATPDNTDDQTKVASSGGGSQARPAPPPQTTFKLAQQERLPVYETVDSPASSSPSGPSPATTIPFFLRSRTTPYRPRIMKYSPTKPVAAAVVPQQQQIALNVIDTEDNDLPTTDVRSSEARNSLVAQAAVEKLRHRLRTTTQDYFNLIREEDAAVPARQTKSRPAPASGSSSSGGAHCPHWTYVMILLATVMPRMLLQRL